VKFKSRFSLLPFLPFAFLVLVFASCSRQKNTVVSRNYHRLTGRDNFYFNAREKVKEGAKTLAESHVDQYDRLLKIFRYADAEKAKAISPDMDEAIKKSSIVIQRHSMVFNGEEKNRWVQESYLLVGKAQFLKHDYWSAIETFQFVASSYNNKPIRFDALLWLTQSYLELGKTPDAEYLLDFLKNDKEFPWKKKRGEYYAIAANYDMQKENYEKAAEELKNAIASTKKKQDRIRYTFILAQLYQKNNDCASAYPLYNRVIKKNAPYEMEFNARINRARCFDINSGSKDIKEQLTKMLKDEKNKDYLDQIYYALATIAEKENQEEQAIDYLKLSVNASTLNTNQKALSYLELAEIYFKRPDYRNAQVYYDSTVAFLSQDHPDYYKSLNKKTSLSKLVRNLDIIAAEDSMQHLASLSPAERQAAIDKIIAKEVEEQEAKKREEELQKEREKEEQENPQNQIFNQGQSPKSNFTPTGGGWYFYNPSAISFGLNEFLKKWGNRKNEDNWRRSSKELGIVENTEETDQSDSTALLEAAQRDSLMALSNEKRKEAYLKAIPVSEESKKQSDDKVIEAYYNAGLIYKEQLDNPKEAADDFEAMLKRYPENKYLLATYYNLYRSYLSLKDSAKADYYKNILLDKYPDSEYSKIILNPNYFAENQKKTAILQVFYENTFRAYQNGQYGAVIERKATADSLFPPNELTPKFEFLKALAVGKTKPVPEFEASLKYVVAKYPKDSVSIRAQEILDFMNKAGKEVKQDSVKAPEPLKEPAIGYVYKQDTVHYVMIVFPNGMVNANELRTKISDFNNQYYSTNEYDISNAFLGNDKQFVLIKEFENDEAALDYYSAILENEAVFEGIPISVLTRFVITPSNMLLMMANKEVGKYDEFFKINYLKTQN
jgi:tetratricopeptide (TPR) repeat protein